MVELSEREQLERWRRRWDIAMVQGTASLMTNSIVAFHDVSAGSGLAASRYYV